MGVAFGSRCGGSSSSVRSLIVVFLAFLAAVVVPSPIDSGAAVPGPAVTGTVTGPFGPVAGVAVKLLDPTYGVVLSSTTTDGSGGYSASLAAPRTVKVEVSDASGVYVKTYNGDTPSFVSAPPVVVGTSPVTVDVTVPSTQGVIAGTVTDTAAAPLAGIRVDFSSAVYGNVFRTTTTDAAGHYQSPPMPPTTFRVQFSDPGGTYASLWNGGAVKFDRASNVTVVANSSVTVDQALPVAARLTGTVTAGGRAGAGGIYVFIGTPVTPSVVIGAAVTAADGTYVIGNLPPGPYKVAVVDPALLADATHTLRPVFHTGVDILSYPSLDEAFVDATPVTFTEGVTRTVDPPLVGVACPTAAGLPSLVGASLGGLDVRGCDFSARSLRGANLDGADLGGVDLTDSLLGNATGTPIGEATAIYDNTECPDFTNSDSHGGTCVGHFTADSTAPTVQISAPPVSADDPTVVTVTVADGGSGVSGDASCSVDDAPTAVTPAGPGAWTFEVTGTGSHALSCAAIDTAGNTGTATATIVIGVAPAFVGVDPIITTYAGTGTYGFSGDGGPATAARLNSSFAVAVDAAGNLFIADTWNHRVRRVDAVTGVISTVAGTGAGDFSGDGGPATAATLSFPGGVALDATGNLFVADSLNQRVRRVDAVTGVISTVAGTGAEGFSGDGGAATAANLYNPHGVAVDAVGNLFFADAGNHRVRRVDAVTGVISTVAGNGTWGFSGDDGPAVAAQLTFPGAVAIDATGNLFIGDSENCRVRRVDAATGVISTVAGTGTLGFSGDGGPATEADLWCPYGVAVDAAGNLFIADSFNNRVRRVDAATGVISTVAGSTMHGFSGDGGPATTAQMYAPTGVAVDAAGNVFIADTSNHRIRRVTPATGAVAGSATSGAPYASTVTVSGAPIPTLSVLSGALPPGLSISGFTVSGTPTSAGTYRGVLRATNAYGTADLPFTITVSP